MAVYYVRSGAGGSANGSSWANAYTSLATAMAARNSGDTFFVSEDHAESAAAGAVSYTITSIGGDNPTKIICVNHAGSVPPVNADITTGATITNTSGGFTFVPQSGSTYGMFYCQGIKWVAAGNIVLGGSVNGAYSTFENCAFELTGSNSNTIGTAVVSAEQHHRLINTTLKFSATGQRLQMTAIAFEWLDTPSALQGATFPTTLVSENDIGADSQTIRFSGVDLSATAGNIFPSAPTKSRKYILENCKLNASATISAGTAASPMSEIQVLGSDSGGSVKRQEIWRRSGKLTTEATIVRSGGASDGQNAFSHKVVTNAAHFDFDMLSRPFECFEIIAWNTATGSSKTLTLECITDNVVLTNEDIWIDVEYLGASGNPLASKATSRAAGSLSAGTNLTTSSASWTTSGMGTPKPQSIAVSFTPQMAGPVRVRVFIAKASSTIYVDPYVAIA